jgi:NAD-dependent DNA ligase
VNRPFTLDENGQPANLSVNAGRRSARSVDEVLGFLKGILADGNVQESEIRALDRWLCANAENDEWPIGVLVTRLNQVMADDRVDPDEIEDLRELFSKITAVGVDVPPFENASTQLPLTQPAPTIIYPGRIFVFTGRFVFGTRKSCQRAVMERGGACQDSITRETSYLVIGEVGSRDWIHTTHGRKIEKAVEYVDRGCPIDIVAEEHWVRSIVPVINGA